MAGNDRQRDPLYRRRRGKVRAGADEALGPYRRAIRSSMRRNPTSPRSACACLFRTVIWRRASFRSREKAVAEQIKADWAAFSGRAQELKLPSAPKQFLHYFEEADRPQTKLDRMLEGGMARLHRPSAPRYAVRLQICLPVLIIPCGEQPAALFCWRNCFARKDISQGNDPEGSDSFEKARF